MSVSDLSDRCLGFFLYYGENASVINCRGLPWPIRPVAFTEVTNAISLSLHIDVPNSLVSLKLGLCLRQFFLISQPHNAFLIFHSFNKSFNFNNI